DGLDLNQLLGYAMTAFYGGRAECHVRRVALPIVYVDFLSMYPTVNALMGLWKLLTAGKIEVVDDTEAVRNFVQRVELEDCFQPETWRTFPVLVQVEPRGEILPVRGAYSGEGTAWQIGINPLHAADGRWYALPDVVAAKLLSRHSPRIVRALRLRPKGRLRGLHPTTLRGTVSVDPRTQDFFKAVIEERRRLDTQLDLPAEDREALNKFLKVLANSSSYGIFAQMDRRDLPSGQKADVTVFGLDSSFSCKVAGPEDPGEFFFAPMAACITAAARLMLAMLERCVADRHGEYVMCDTDSMAIVASERGGLVPCVGGRERLADEAEAVQALSWADVEEIRELFAALSPYDRDAVTGSILKLEDENYAAEHVNAVDHEHDPASCPRTQLHIDAISAKRYALFNRAEDGRPLLRWEHDAESTEADDEGGDEEHGAAPMLRKNSEHGLGHLLNPLDPNSDRKEWMQSASESIVCEDVGISSPALPWLAAPAMTQITVSTPKLFHTFDTLNKGRLYVDQVKPFNFIMSPHVAATSLPEDVSPLRFHLFAPYAEDPSEWLNIVYTDMHSKARRTYMVTTEDGPSSAIGVKTYGDVLREYRTHPDTTALGADGQRCGRQTRGVLGRRPVRELSVTYLGKEGNRLEDVQAGLIHDPKEVINEYPDPRRDPFRLHVTPVLREIPIRELVDKTGKSERALQAIRNDHAEPRRELRRTLMAIAGDYVRAELRGRGVDVPNDDLPACALYVNMTWLTEETS
ncbi:MAG TPA: hypothetical protein VEU08_15525, partial [Vicinamibacterales bacterium]|nr:hypothetical protein [Vicinamibacterales bacterium]